MRDWDESDAAKHLPVLHYCFDYVKDTHEDWHDELTIPYGSWDGSANVFRSEDIGDADLSDLDVGPHTISIYVSKLCDNDYTTVYDSNGDNNYTANFTLIKTIDVPVAAGPLTYDGTVQTGVAAGTGYTLTDNTATGAGSYTATATLAQYYKWSDGTTAPKTISWSIAARPLTITAGDASKTAGDPDPAFSASITSGSLATGQSIS